MGRIRVFFIKAFMFSFAYVVTPMCLIFNVAGGLLLSVYTLKIFTFFRRGTFTLFGDPEPLCMSLLITPLELGIGAVAMAAVCLLYWLYCKFDARIAQQHYKQQIKDTDTTNKAEEADVDFTVIEV